MNVDFFRLVELDPMGWLTNIPNGLIEQLANRTDTLSIAAGQALFRLDDPTGGLFGIVSGRVDSHLGGMPEGKTLVHCSGPGWWLGDIAAVSGKPRRFDVVAGRASTVVRLSRAELLRVCGDHLDVLQNLMQMMAATSHLVLDGYLSLRLDDPTERVAACLLRLHKTGPGWNGHLPVTQAELACMANLSRRRVIAALARLETTGCIERTYGEVFVKSPQKLAKERTLGIWDH